MQLPLKHKLELRVKQLPPQSTLLLIMTHPQLIWKITLKAISRVCNIIFATTLSINTKLACMAATKQSDISTTMYRMFYTNGKPTPGATVKLILALIFIKNKIPPHFLLAIADKTISAPSIKMISM
ncbi:hypothetical protein D3C75_743510 [compost metagenome]